MKKGFFILICLLLSVITKAQAPPMCFETIANYNHAFVTKHSHFVVTGDFNSDGILDLAIANSTAEISIHIGYGNGVFAAPVNYPVYGFPQTIIVKDFNSDGNLDLAVTNYNNNTANILIGTGTGTFGSAGNLFAGFNTQPGSLTSGDFNGDGLNDLASANQVSNQISVWLNTISGMGFRVSYTVGKNQMSITCADFNSDGKMDLATANFLTNDISIMIGSGTGTFSSSVSYSVGTRPSSIVSGDFNMDGKQDLAVANDISGNVSILTGSGLGTFSVTATYSVGVSPRFLTIADFNGDGKTDLATANYGSDDISVLLGSGTGAFSSSGNFNVGDKPLSISSGDYDSDGLLDMAVANASADKTCILIGNGLGTFKSRIINSVGSNQNSLIANDFNGDGISDLAVANFATNDVTILNGSGTGTFTTIGNYSVGSQPTSIVSADFNGDGREDLATANNNSDNISVLLGSNVLGVFNGAANYSVGISPYSIVTGDFNNDGNVDLATGNFVSNDLTVLIGTGSGSFLSPVNYSVGLAPSSLVTGDFNADGNIDIAVTNFGSNDLSILIGSGLGTFASPVNYGALGKPLSIAKGDFNQDGIIDLATSYQNGAIKTYTGLGTGAFLSNGNTITPALYATPLISADFNGDSYTDLAVVGRSSNNINVLSSSGTGTFSIFNLYADSLAPVFIVASDVNGDGKMDIIATNNFSNSLITLLNNNPPVISIIGTNTICIGSSTILNPTGALTYTWNGSAPASSLTISPNATSTYTVSGTDAIGCTNTQTINVFVDNTCADVWPGDANSDGVSDNLDVLELGLHYTQTGPPRASTSNAWQSYFANNWTGSITNGKNLNHSDCNGDGIIDDNDTLAIYNNYGLTHAFKPAQTNTVNPQLSIVPDQAFVAKGNWGTASVYLGEASTNINNINGVAFTVDFDNTLIETNSVYIEYQNSFLDAGQNLHFRKLDFANSKFFTATTHTVNNNVSGNGLIAKLHYQIKSTLTTDEVLNIGLSQANQSDVSGTITPLTVGTGTLMAIGASVGLQELNGNAVSISPNPTSGLLTITSKTELQKIEVVSITGQVLLSEILTNVSHTLHLENFANGIYFVNVYQNDRVVKREKFVLNK